MKGEASYQKFPLIASLTLNSFIPTLAKEPQVKNTPNSLPFLVHIHSKSHLLQHCISPWKTVSTCPDFTLSAGEVAEIETPQPGCTQSKHKHTEGNPWETPSVYQLPGVREGIPRIPRQDYLNRDLIFFPAKIKTCRRRRTSRFQRDKK